MLFRADILVHFGFRELQFLTQTTRSLVISDNDIGGSASVDRSLHDLLFEGPGACHVLIDASHHAQLADMIKTGARQASCLYKGEAYHRWGHVAPWLMTVSPDERILRRLLQRGKADWMLWDRAPAVFMRSSSDHGQLVQHFRRFVKRRDEAGNWMFFRFQDPSVLSPYLTGISDWPQRLNDIFRPRDGEPITRIMTADPAANSVRIFEPNFETDALRNPSEPAAPGIMTARELAIFSRAEDEKLGRQIADWLLRLDPARFEAIGDQARFAIADHALVEGRRFNMRFAEEVCWLLYGMTYFGGWCFRSARYVDLIHAASSDSQRGLKLSKAIRRRAGLQYGAAEKWQDGIRQTRKRIVSSYEVMGWRGLNREKAMAIILPGQDENVESADVERLMMQQDQLCISNDLKTESALAAARILANDFGLNFFNDPLRSEISGFVAGSGLSERILKRIFEQVIGQWRADHVGKTSVQNGDYWQLSPDITVEEVFQS